MITKSETDWNKADLEMISVSFIDQHPDVEDHQKIEPQNSVFSGVLDHINFFFKN
jgi:hypothetical protein